MTPSPSLPDGYELAVANALRAFWTEPGETRELRAFDVPGDVATVIERYAEPLDLARRALELSTLGARGVYFTPNPLRPGPFQGAARAEDVHRRYWLYLDVDPVRPEDAAGHSATAAEHKEAEAYAQRLLEALQGQGLDTHSAAIHDSGNGYHLCVPIDLANDEPSRRLVAAYLQGLAERITHDGVHLDTAVFDAGRVIRVPGTVARKGPPSQLRPHRRGRALITVPWSAQAAAANTKALVRTVEAWSSQGKSGAAGTPPPADHRAKKYLEKEEPSVSGQGGHNRAFHVAMILVEGFAIRDWDTFQEVIAPWNARCQPPWSERELRHKFESALEKASSNSGYLNRGGDRGGRGAGTETPAADELAPEDPVDEDAPETATATFADLREVCAGIQWLWPGWLLDRAINTLAAGPKVGKTRFVLEAIRRVQYREPWPDGCEQSLEPDAKFLWVLADGNHQEVVDTALQFGLRMDTLLVNATKADPMGGRELTFDAHWRDLYGRIVRERPKLLVIDTLTYVTAVSLNLAEEAQGFITRLQRVCLEFGTAVLALVHVNKEGQALGKRFLGASRVNLMLHQRPDPADLPQEKRRAAAQGNLWRNQRYLGVLQSNFRLPGHSILLTNYDWGMAAELDYRYNFATGGYRDKDKERVTNPLPAPATARPADELVDPDSEHFDVLVWFVAKIRDSEAAQSWNKTQWANAAMREDFSRLAFEQVLQILEERGIVRVVKQQWRDRKGGGKRGVGYRYVVENWQILQDYFAQHTVMPDVPIPEPEGGVPGVGVE